jgi:hypothetical protein
MTIFPIHFEVKEVREYLKKNGYVFTIRNSYRSTGKTRAIYKCNKSLYDLGQVNITLVLERIKNFEELIPYVHESGFKYRSTMSRDETKIINGFTYIIVDGKFKDRCIAEYWLKLAQELSGNDLALFKVELVGGKSLNSGLAMC